MARTGEEAPCLRQSRRERYEVPAEQLARRKIEIETRIGALARRKEDAIASFDRVIANKKAELDALRTQKSATGVPEPTKHAAGTSKKSKKSKSKRP